ncbi:hypothetical protein V2J09_001481 [Rumex salicifolius]
MVKPKKELLSSAPWRVEDKKDEFAGGKLRVTSQPGGDSTMYVPGKKKPSNRKSADDEEDSQIDSELRYTFQRNYQFLQQVFTIDTLVKPLPPTQAYYVSRSLSFFTSIFTQFFDPEGIAKAQKSLGIGEEEKVRRFMKKVEFRKLERLCIIKLLPFLLSSVGNEMFTWLGGFRLHPKKGLDPT